MHGLVEMTVVFVTVTDSWMCQFRLLTAWPHSGQLHHRSCVQTLGMAIAAEAEPQVQQVSSKGYVRSIKLAVESASSVEVPADHDLLTWLATHAGARALSLVAL